MLFTSVIRQRMVSFYVNKYSCKVTHVLYMIVYFYLESNL